MPDLFAHMAKGLHLGRLSIFCLLLALFMSPTLAMWLMLMAHAAYMLTGVALLQFMAFLRAPWLHVSAMLSTAGMLLYVFGANALFAVAAITCAEKHEVRCQQATMQDRSQHRFTWLVVFDTWIKCVTAVAAIAYCQLMLSTGRLFVPSIWLTWLGFGVMVHGFLGLHAMANAWSYLGDDQLDMQSRFLRDQLDDWYAFRARILGRWSLHPLVDYAAMSLLALCLAPSMPYHIIWPGFYLMVGVQYSVRLFAYVIRDVIFFQKQLRLVLFQRQYWDGQRMLPVRRVSEGLLVCFRSLTLLGLLRALVGYTVLHHYVGLNVLALAGAFWIPFRLFLYTTFWSTLSFTHGVLLPFTIAPLILISLMILDDESHLRIQPNPHYRTPILALFLRCEAWVAAVFRLRAAQDQPERVAKIRVIYQHFMMAVLGILLLYTVVPVTPWGFHPLNEIAATLLPMARPLLLLGNRLFVLMVQKTIGDCLAERIAATCREQGRAAWLCQSLERGFGFSVAVASLGHDWVILSPLMVDACHQLVHGLLYYSGVSWMYALASAAIHAVLHWTGLAHFIAEWAWLSPTSWVFAYFRALTVHQVALMFMLWPLCSTVISIGQAVHDLPWRRWRRACQPLLTVGKKLALMLSASYLAVRVWLDSMSIVLAYFQPMTWQAALFSYVAHVLSLLFVGMMVYVWGCMMPRIFKDLAKQKEKRDAVKSSQGHDPRSSSSMRPHAPSSRENIGRSADSSPDSPEDVDQLPEARPLSPTASGEYRPLPQQESGEFPLGEGSEPSAPPEWLLRQNVKAV